MDTFDKIQETLVGILEGETQKESFAEDVLQSKAISELREMCKSLGIPVYGRKAEVIERLLKHSQAEAVEVPEVMELGKGEITATPMESVENNGQQPARPKRV